MVGQLAGRCAAQILNIPPWVVPELAPPLPGSGRNQNKGKSASNTPDFQIFKSEILKHSVAKLSSKQRAWNWTAIGFAVGENSAPVHNKRILRMMDLNDVIEL